MPLMEVQKLGAMYMSDWAQHCMHGRIHNTSLLQDQHPTAYSAVLHNETRITVSTNKLLHAQMYAH